MQETTTTKGRPTTSQDAAIPPTTVRVYGDDWRRLQALKAVPGDTVADVVRRLLDAAERREGASTEAV